jgi:hypothetical protein
MASCFTGSGVVLAFFLLSAFATLPEAPRIFLANLLLADPLLETRNRILLIGLPRGTGSLLTSKTSNGKPNASGSVLRKISAEQMNKFSEKTAVFAADISETNKLSCPSDPQ